VIFRRAGPPLLRVLPTFLGSLPAGRGFLWSLRQAAEPLTESIALTTYPALQTSYDHHAAWGLRRAAASAQPAGLPTTELAALGRQLPHDGAHLGLWPTSAPDRWTVHAAAQWRDAADDAANREWITAVTARLHPSSADRSTEGVRS